MSNNNKKFLAGQVSWAAGNQIVQTLLAFASLAILSRLLTPSAYGLYSLGLIYVGFIEIVVGSHMLDFIVQHRALTRAHINSATACVAAFGIVNLILGNWFSASISVLANDPQLQEIIPIMTLIAFIGGLSNIPAVLLTKNLQFDRIAQVDLVCAVVSIAAGVLLAHLEYGFYTLPLMELVRRTLRLILGALVAKWRPGFRFGLSDIVEFWNFSRLRIVSISFVYVTSSSPRYFVGLLLGAESLGMFVVANRLVEQLVGVMVYPFAAVAFPAAAKIKDETQLARFLKQTLLAVSGLLWPTTLGFAAVAPSLVPLVFGEKWQVVSHLSQILIFLAFKATISALAMPIFLIANRPELQAKLDFVDAITTVGFIFLGAKFGLLPAVIAMLVRSILMIPLIILLLKGVTKLSFRSQIWELVYGAAPASLMFVVVCLIHEKVTAHNLVAVDLLAMIASGIVAQMIFWLLFNPSMAASIWTFVYNKAQSPGREAKQLD